MKPVYKPIILSAILASTLTGCGTATSQMLAKGSYQVEYVENEAVSGPGLVLAKMNEKAMELCPNGYDKLKDRTFKKGTAPAHRWEIKCLKEGENE